MTIENILLSNVLINNETINNFSQNNKPKPFNICSICHEKNTILKDPEKFI